MTTRQFKKWLTRTGFTKEDVAVASGKSVKCVAGYTDVTRSHPPTYMRLVCIGMEAEREVRRARIERNRQR